MSGQKPGFLRKDALKLADSAKTRFLASEPVSRLSLIVLFLKVLVSFLESRFSQEIWTLFIYP